MLSDNIRNYRKENKLSQDELAEKLGVSRQSISLWENGQTQPTVDNIIALARYSTLPQTSFWKAMMAHGHFRKHPSLRKKGTGC